MQNMISQVGKIVKAGLVQNASRLGNLNFFLGKKTKCKFGLKENSMYKVCETFSSTTDLEGTTRPKAGSGNMPCQSFFVDILSKYIPHYEGFLKPYG